MNKPFHALCIAAVCFVLAAAAAEAKEITLALFPFDANASGELSEIQAGIKAMLPGRLSMPGQIVVVEAGAGAKAGGLTAADRLSLAKKAEAGYLLSGTITKIGATISIDARLVDAGGDEPPVPISVQSTGLDGIIPQLNVLAQKARSILIEKIEPGTGLAQAPGAAAAGWSGGSAAAGGQTQDYTPQHPRRPRSAPTRFTSDMPRRDYGAGPGPLFEAAPAFTVTRKNKPLTCLCAGDINGDGKTELIAAGPDIIIVYSLTGATLSRTAEIPVGISEHVVHIDAGDFNGNGVDELYVSSYEAQRANSFVIEFQKDRFERILEKQRWFYRAYRLSDKSVKLIGQKAGTASPYSGDILNLQWKEGKLISREQFILPGSRDLYGFGEGDIDADGVTDFLVFDRGIFNAQPELTMVTTTSRTVWRDTGRLGGTQNFFLVYAATSDIEQKEYVPLRIICEDLSPDGRWAAIVGRNYNTSDGLLGKLTDFNQGQVQCLLWDGADLAANWTSAPADGTVRDYILTDLDRDGTRELIILATRPAGLLSASTNVITAYRLK